MPNLSSLLPNELQQLKFETQLKFYSSISGVISQSFSWKLLVSFDKCQIFQKYPYFVNFTIEMIGNKTAPLLKFVDLNRKCINQSES